MVVTWGKPGDKNFKWSHVSSKAKAYKWRELVAQTEGWEAGMGGGIYTEAAAKDLKYPDGSKVVTYSGLNGFDAVRKNATTNATLGLYKK